MKKTITKIIITVASLVLFMMALPWLAIKFADGWAVTGLWMFAFFIVNPALVIGLSIMAGTELRRVVAMERHGDQRCLAPIGRDALAYLRMDYRFFWNTEGR